MKVYQDDFVTVYHAEWQAVDIPVFDHALTDPPYGDSTHDKALTLRSAGSTGELGKAKGGNRRDVARKLVQFDSIGYDDFESMVSTLGALCQHWFIMTCERKYSRRLEDACDSPSFPLSFIRECIYIKPNGMPQVSGDRPAQPCEYLPVLHRKGNGRLRWNSGGKRGVYTHNKPHAPKHPTEKPLSLYLELLADFTNPGDLILDPFGGSGKVAMACKIMQRRCIIIERDKKYVDLIVRNVKETQAMPLSLLPEPIQEVMI